MHSDLHKEKVLHGMVTSCGNEIWCKKPERISYFKISMSCEMASIPVDNVIGCLNHVAMWPVYWHMESLKRLQDSDWVQGGYDTIFYYRCLF